jgi:hypothetical protein
MKNMKIKSYTNKKNTVLNKDKSDYNSNVKPAIEISNLNNNVLNDVEKILKSPGLNISLSKLDEKGKNKNNILGNRMIDINFFNNNRVKSSMNTINNTVNNSLINQTSNNNKNLLNSPSQKNSTHINDPSFESKLVDKNINNKINIKLKINSEVINNNICIEKKNNSKIEKSSEEVFIN